MRCARLCYAALLAPFLFCFTLPGCDTRHGEWDATSPQAPEASTSAPAPPPAAREVTVAIGANGKTTCRVDGTPIDPLSPDEILRPEAIRGRRILIVHNNEDDTEHYYAVPFDVDNPELTSSGRVTFQHIQHNLLLEMNAPASITLTAGDPQGDSDELRQSAEDGDISGVAARLAADPGMIDVRDPEHGDTALMRAAAAGHEDVVQLLLDRNANTETKDNDGHTALHLAVIRGNLGVVKQLVQHGANTNTVTAAGNTPIHLALKNNRTDIAEYLAGAGASGNIPDQSGKTPMQVALDKVFELNERRDYGPFPDGSSLRWSKESLYVRRAGQSDPRDWQEFDLPSAREGWVSLEGTPFLVTVRGNNKHRLWGRYYPTTSAVTNP